MNILLGLNSFFIGGAENFVFRLAKALSEKGHKIYLFVLNDWGMENAKKRLEIILGKENNKINIITRYKPGKFADFFLWKINRIFMLIGKHEYREKLIHKIQIKELNVFLKKEKIDIINTHLWEVDEFIANYFTLPQVITMHGPYEFFLHKHDSENISSNIIDHHFVNRAGKVINKSRNIIYTADKNLEIFNHIKCPQNFNIEKIYIGYRQEKSLKFVKNISDGFVFGMIARGMESKGWEFAIKAFQILQEKYPDVKMIFAYVETEFMQRISLKYKHVKGLTFLGYVNDQSELFNAINVLIFPTWFDCLPNSIIESLFHGVPVISTNVGEIPRMIVWNEKEAGIILILDKNTKKPVVEDIMKAMERYLLNNILYEEHKKNTAYVSEQFSMDICVKSYIEFYRHAIIPM
jgi:glycosyltransferase involved in cell wall biosynthesis